MSSEDDPFEEVSTAVRPIVEDAAPRLARAVVIEGPDAGKIFELDPSAPSRTLIGISPACQFQLTDGSVSRRHCALEPVGQRFRVRDLGSTNGTFVDGVAVTDAFVRGGETLRLGGTAISLEADAVADAPPLTSATRFGKTVGASVAMRRLYPLCERLAAVRIPVLIEGETGTGKEVLAESLYEVSGAKGPFVVFDCTTVAPSLVESELFGHERGAFTGAVGTRAGVFEEADGGTLLIDEIGDLDLALQAKLLRVLDRGEVRRVGSQKTMQVDVRILAATRRDLDREVAAGRFRDDLYHRLAVARIELPPLRDRDGDVPLLARQFAWSIGGKELPPVLVGRFEAYAWPGNVRELRNAVARYLALGDPGLGAERSSSRPPPSGVAYASYSNLPFPIARRKALADFERRYVEEVLAAHDGNVAHAAKASGIALRYFRLVKARLNANKDAEPESDTGR